MGFNSGFKGLNFCCRAHFVRPDVRVERYSDVNKLFPEMEEMLIEKVRQRTFLYDTESPDYRDQHKRMGRDREGVENKT